MLEIGDGGIARGTSAFFYHQMLEKHHNLSTLRPVRVPRSSDAWRRHCECCLLFGCGLLACSPSIIPRPLPTTFGLTEIKKFLAIFALRHAV